VSPELLEPYSRRFIASQMAGCGSAPLARLEQVSERPSDVKRRVRDFWQREPCGSTLTYLEPGSPEFFAEVERTRYSAEPFISEHADFAGAAGKSVLEIGVGLGTDFIRFARAGARMTGIDITPRAVELVRGRLRLEGLEAEVLVADAERLPFADGSFDRVYSWGVLHHTPDTSTAIREAIRVTRPGGELCVMLYGRRSWAAAGAWIRNALLRRRPFKSISQVLAESIESEGTKGYTQRELREMFRALQNLRVESVVTVYDKRYFGPLTRITGNRFGWFRVIRGRRPEDFGTPAQRRIAFPAVGAGDQGVT
jgi:ubiquinone/menaquinone biosynthesis C-methylase UbiE